MSSWRETWQKVLILVSVSAVGYAVHIMALHFFKIYDLRNGLLAAYLANTIIAMAILALLMRLPERLQNSLGFLYLAGSMVKFIVYFIFFYPVYKADGDVSRQEFTMFFIPYSLCLIAETTVLIRKLNKQP